MKSENEIEELLAKNMHYHQPSFIAGFKKGKESQFQALKEEVGYKYNKSVEEVENLSNEDPILFSKGKRNAFKEVLNLITNLEDN